MALITDASELSRQNRILLILERKYGPKVARVLMQTVNSLTVDVFIDQPALEFLLQREDGRIRDVMDAMHEAAYKTNGVSFARTHMLSGTASDVVRSIMTNAATFAQQATAYVAPLIHKTTRKFVIEAGRKVTENALGGQAAKDAVNAARDSLGQISKVRAARISRTAGHEAATKVHRDAVHEAGLDIVKRRWLTAQDERVRAAHAEAHGQERIGDVPFDVGGEKLTRPGDPNGSPWNIINCRCAERLFLQ